MINSSALCERANGDGEYRLHARSWHATIAIIDDSSGERANFAVEDGQMTPAPVTDAPADLTISAPATDWTEILKPIPKPFFHDPRGAQAHHGLRITGELAHRAAYHAAVRRLFELMREINNA